uniref:Nxph3 protein n=1 Tax=Mus musculus TaxID=10090 RepID=Q91VW1_MOUSE|nr:Nxph3 protein [Mus musculus]
MATSSPPLGVCCHDSRSPARPFLSRNPLSLPPAPLYR